MDIFFFAGKCSPIHARSLDERPLGGTETGLIRVAEILQSRGHKVTVFTSHPNPLNFDSAPTYRPANQIMIAGACDVFIAVQDWWPLFAPVQAKARWFWTGDGADQYINFGLGDRRVTGRIDRLLAVSNWHAHHLCAESGFPIERAFVVRNGVHLPWFAGSEPRQRRRLIYTSTPYRGLELVPSIYTELKNRCTDIELHVFSGLKVYDTDTPFTGPRQEEFDRLLPQLHALPDCTVHGNILQKDLSRELMRSGLYFYPNTWRETSCICCIEAKAAGCPIVTSAFGALPETVGGSGYVINEAPGSPAYQAAFVAACEKILNDHNVFEQLSNHGRTEACAAYSWEHVGDRFLELLG